MTVEAPTFSILGSVLIMRGFERKHQSITLLFLILFKGIMLYYVSFTRATSESNCVFFFQCGDVTAI